MTNPNQDDAEDTTLSPDVGSILVEIATALNDLGAVTTPPDARIGSAAATLSQINAEWASNPAQAAIDAHTLAMELGALFASFPQSSELANAIDCAQQLAGTWSGDDYVPGAQ